MKIIITIFFLIICIHSAYSQEKGSSVTKSYYKSGSVKSISYGINYRKDRITYFDEEGSIISERKYIDQEGNQVISFFEKGKLKSNYAYKDDKKNGKATGFFDSGTVKWERSYKNDLRNGKWTWYYENGLISNCSYFEDDKAKLDSIFYYDGRFSTKVEHYYYRSGLEKRIYYNSKLIKIQESYFRNEKLNGVTTNYYENGFVKFTGVFRNGRMSGERLYYNETGEFCNGKFTIYNDSGYVEREGSCIKGRPEGELKVYNIDKDLVIKANFKNGKANGLSYYYSPNDSTILIELYKNGRFLREVKEK